MNKLGITSKLTLIFVLFAGAVLVGLGIPAYNNGSNALEAATYSEILTTALEKQAALGNWVADRQHSIGDIANQAQLRETVTALMAATPGSPDAVRAYADLVTNLQNWAGEGHRFRSMEVIDSVTGRVIASTDATEEGKFREEQPYFIEGLKAAYVQNPYYDLARQRPGMTAATPIQSPDGRVIAVLAGPLNMDEMDAIILRRSGLHQTDDAFLVNTSNLFVTQPRLNPDPAVLQRGVHTVAVNRCLTHLSGVASAPDYRDVPAFIVYRWLPDRQLCLITKIDQDEALAPARALASTMALTGGLVFLVGSIVAFWMSRNFVRPVINLAQGAEQIGQGHLDTRIEVKSGDEIGKLGIAFNQMAIAIGEKETQLRKWTTELEQRVDERTTELSASEERYRILAETSPDLIFVIGQDDKIQYVNMRAASQFGKTPEQVIGEARTELFPPGIAENQALGLQQVLKSGEPSSSESPITFPGSQLWLDTQLVPLRNKAGEVSAVMGVSRDITERKRAEEDLLIKNQVFEDAVIAQSITDPAAVINACNPEFLRMWGYVTQAQVIGQRVDSFLVNPEEAGVILEALGKGGVWKGEYLAKRADGTTFMTRAFITCLLNPEGQLLGYQATNLDVTKEKEAEQQIKQLNTKLEAMVEKRTAQLRDTLELNLKIIDSSSLGIFACRADGPCIIANPAVARISGATVEKMLQLNFRQLESWKKNGLFEKVETALATGKEQRAEIHLTTVFNKDAWITYYITTFSNNGQPHFLMLVDDITERKLAEQALREGEERIQLIVEQTRDYAMFMLDPSGNVVTWNIGAERIEQFSEAEIIGKHFSIFHSPEEIQIGKPEAELQAALAQGRYEEDGLRVRKDGSTFWANIIVTPLKDESGNLRGFSKVTRDITERKQAEEELTKYREHLEELVKDRTEEVRKAMEDLARSNAELERFAYVASHDLQEPLRMVTSYLQLLERRYKDKLDGDALEFINYAVDGSNRMKTLISDLLAYSRVGTRGKDFALADCEDVIARVLTNLQIIIEENQAQVTHDPLPKVMADNAQLESLFQNLIGNAIKFHGEKSPRIHMGVKKEERNWVFSVSDNGIGIDPQYFERIFIIFQRLHNREEYPGTGIGLAISKRIVERHGGRMWIESKPGQGSTFFFTLPFNGESK